VGDVLVCTDARRRQVYWARYDRHGERVEGPELAPPGEVATRFQSRDLTVVGAGVIAHADAFSSMRVNDDDGHPSAVAVIAVAAARVASAAPAERLEPLYLRRPDAVPSAGPKRVLPA